MAIYLEVARPGLLAALTGAGQNTRPFSVLQNSSTFCPLYVARLTPTISFVFYSEITGNNNKAAHSSWKTKPQLSWRI